MSEQSHQTADTDGGSLVAVLFGRMSARVVGVLCIRGLLMLVSLVTSVILARLLGVDGFGIYNYAFAIVALLGLPLQSGAPILITRLVSTYELRSEAGLMHGLLRRSLQFAVGGGVALAGIAGVFITTVSPAANLAPLSPFLVSLLLVPAAAVAAVYSAFLSGLGQVVKGQLCHFLVRPALLLLAIGIAAGWGRPIDTPEAAAAARVTAGLAAAAFAGWLLRSAWRQRVQREFDTPEWLRRCLPLVVLGGLQLLTARTDTLMLGALLGADAVGIYAPATQGASLVIVGLMALNAAIGPTVARMHVGGATGQLQRLATWTARCAALWALPVAGVLIPFGGTLLSWIYGSDYAGGAAALAILCVAQIVNAGLGPVGLLLTMTGHESDAMRGVLVAALLNVVLNVLLIPHFGASGAAVATGISIVTWNLLLMVFVRRRLGIDPSLVGLRAEERS